MKSACSRAAAKLSIGLSLLVAVIGIRVLTATPPGIESDFKELERLDVQLASESTVATSKSHAADPSWDDSIGSRLSAGIRERIPGFESARSRDGDKLVSCRLDGANHFMRADDCAMRGGRSTIVSRD